MTTTCPHCKAKITGSAAPGAIFACPKCKGIVKAPEWDGSKAPSRAPEAPWRDTYLAPFAALAGVFCSAVCFILWDEQAGNLVAALAGGALFIWGLALLRACAFRLQHLEELLAEQNAGRE